MNKTSNPSTSVSFTEAECWRKTLGIGAPGPGGPDAQLIRYINLKLAALECPIVDLGFATHS